MEEPINRLKIPATDSIKELAAFWDTHDLTDFEAELEEAAGPVFERGITLEVHLAASEAGAVQEMARAVSLSCGQLLRQWVLEKLAEG